MMAPADPVTALTHRMTPRAAAILLRRTTRARRKSLDMAQYTKEAQLAFTVSRKREVRFSTWMEFA